MSPDIGRNGLFIYLFFHHFKHFKCLEKIKFQSFLGPLPPIHHKGSALDPEGGYNAPRPPAVYVTTFVVNLSTMSTSLPKKQDTPLLYHNIKLTRIKTHKNYGYFGP